MFILWLSWVRDCRHLNYEHMLETFIYDIEVFKYDWIVVMVNVRGGEPIVYHNNNGLIAGNFTAAGQKVLGGFNNKHYDDWIIQTMILGGDNAKVKEHNDWIISGKNPWEFPFVQYQKKPFYSFDLRDDLPMGLSLKAIEANMQQRIVETGVDFNIDRPLTEDELQLEIDYCKSDVMNTVKLYQARQGYLDSKLAVGNLKGIPEREAIGLTNAKLTAKFLDAKKVMRNDEFDYPLPDNLVIGKYKPVLAFFKDPLNYTDSILKDELAGEIKPRRIATINKQLDELQTKGVYTTQLDIDIAGVPHTYAWGGLHGARSNYFIEQDDDHKILTVDVSSYYPSLMIQYDLLSRNTPSPQGFKDVYKRRIKAKNEGDSATAGALKLVLNTTYGASKNKYNDLFDPRQANAVCVYGQLFLTDLIDKLEAVDSFELIQSNTDGIIIRFKNDDESAIETVLHGWEQRTRMNMERTVMKVIAQKDVNNYVMKKGESYIYEDGRKVVIDEDVNAIKTKGAYVSLFKGGDFKNKSMVILHKALVNYFMNKTPVEQTINDATEVSEFQMIAKTGSTYNHAVHVIDGKDVIVQKTNRVYASNNERFGTLYKIKSNGRRDKIASLPDHCITDNEGNISIDQIDKQFYIDLALKRINDYLGNKKGRRKMPAKKTTKAVEVDASKMNLFEKISAVREEFLKANIQKSGINRFAGFKYFELGDIVPAVIELTGKYHLTTAISFNEDSAVLRVIDRDSLQKTDSQISTFDFEEYRSPMVELTVKGMNAIQALGAVQTYQRRYLYMMFLDIIEQDAIDAGQDSDKSEPTKGSDKTETPKKPTRKPATPSERKSAKGSVTKADEPMPDVMKESLKQGLKKLRAKDDKYEPWIGKAAAKIKGGLTKAQGEKLLIKIGEKVAE